MGNPFRSRWFVRSAIAGMLLTGIVAAVILAAADDNAVEVAIDPAQTGEAQPQPEPEPDQAEASPVAPAEPPTTAPEPRCDAACKAQIAAAQERNNTTTTLPRVPDVHGMTPADAEAVLARTGLTVRNIAEREVPDEHVGVIVDQSPTPGIESRTGEVRLILGIPTTTTTAATTVATQPTGPAKADSTTPTLPPEATTDTDGSNAPDTDPPAEPAAPKKGDVDVRQGAEYEIVNNPYQMDDGRWWVCERVTGIIGMDPFEECGPVGRKTN